jgi:uncharacterized protein involved in exopolysaccharide biosynthesis/Mrp family chromosome partitioning ATPase
MNELLHHKDPLRRSPSLERAAYDSAQERKAVNRQVTSLRDFILILFRHRALVAAVFLGTILGTCLWLWLGHETYETSARVLIKFARDAADPRTSLSPSTTRVLPSTRPDINTEAELIKSYALAEEVVATLHLDQPQRQVTPTDILPWIKFQLRRAYHGLQDLTDEVQIRLAFKERLSEREKAIVALVKGLKVETVKDSSIVKVNLSTPSRAGAGLIVNTLLNIYRQHRLAVEKNSGETYFFESQAKEYSDKLREREKELQTLKQKYDIASLPDQVNLKLKNVTDVEQAARESASVLAATEAKIALLKSQLQKEAPTRVASQVESRNSELDFLNERKAGLDLEKQKLVAKYGENHIEVQGLNQQIDKVKQLIAEADQRVKQSETTSPNTTYLDLEKELLTTTQLFEFTKARYQSQMTTLAAYKAELRALLHVEIAYNQTSREIQVNEETYRLHERNAIEAKAAEALSSGGITSIEFVDPAVDPILPSGIRATYLAGGSVLIGLILAVGLALVTETLDHSVSRPEELEAHLGCSVWSCVSFDKLLRDSFPPLGILKQQFLAIASKLDAEAGSEKIVLFSATGAKVGATTVAAGVAYALSSQLGKKILVAEVTGGVTALAAKMRVDSAQSRQIDIAEDGWRDSCRQVNGNLNLVSFKLLSRDLTEKEIAERIRLLPQIFPEYEYILVDVASSLPAHDRMGVARACGGVVLVVEAGKTRYEVLERLREEFHREGVMILGAVLNRRRFPIPRRLYDSI